MNLETLTVNRRSNSTNFTGSVNPRCLNKDRVTINVGGFRHETLLSTLRVVPDSRLAWVAEHASNQADYDPETEYFFDRHPAVFASVLNYYRTGKLHCPGEVCGPLFQEELIFWGIDELQMEPCCWSNYTQHREAQETLKAFEKDPNEQDDNPFAVDPGAPARIQWKQRMWAMLEQPHSSKYAQILAFISLVVIVLSVATFCMESVPYFRKHKPIFEGLEYFYCIVFSADLFARLLCCPDKIAFIKSFMTWVDLLSVIPLYISIANDETETIEFLFVLRLVRIFRLFRFFRTMSGMQVIGHTLRASARELFLLVLILTIPMVIFSTLVFYAEKTEHREDFNSIPETFWWAMITMTTVGYGDVYPRTLLGRLIGTFCACVGVLIVALPVSVIGSNFTLFYSHAQAQLKLPQKKRKPLLLGAAGALVSETTLFNGEVDIEISETAAETHPNLTEGSIAPPKVLRNPSITPRRSTAFPKMKEALSRISCSEPNLPESPPEKAVSPEEVTSSAEYGAEQQRPHAISAGLISASDVVLQITGPTHRRMAISPMISPAGRRRSQRRRRRAGSQRDAETSGDHMHKKERDSCYTTTDPDSPAESGKRFSDESPLDGKEGKDFSPTGARGYDGRPGPREGEEPITGNKVPRQASWSHVNAKGSVECVSDSDSTGLHQSRCCEDSVRSTAHKDPQRAPAAQQQQGSKAQNERRLSCESPTRNWPLRACTYSQPAATSNPNTETRNSRGGSKETLRDPEPLGSSLRKGFSSSSLNNGSPIRGSDSLPRGLDDYLNSRDPRRTSQNKMYVLAKMSAR